MTGNTMPYLGELYVELTTRKLAIDFNEKNDRIDEVYNTWFKFFSWCREQMKEMASEYSDIIPIIHKVSKVDYSLTATEKKYVKMYNLYLECMEIMRPHLERYSYDFRIWKESACYNGSKHKDFQRSNKSYEKIIIDIADINKKYQHIVEEIVDHIIKYGD
jgi:hypothetical protein